MNWEQTVDEILRDYGRWIVHTMRPEDIGENAKLLTQKEALSAILEATKAIVPTEQTGIVTIENPYERARENGYIFGVNETRTAMLEALEAGILTKGEGSNV